MTIGMIQRPHQPPPPPPPPPLLLLRLLLRLREMLSLTPPLTAPIAAPSAAPLAMPEGPPSTPLRAPFFKPCFAPSFRPFLSIVTVTLKPSIDTDLLILLLLSGGLRLLRWSLSIPLKTTSSPTLHWSILSRCQYWSSVFNRLATSSPHTPEN